jgi:glycosyltransferase involved in cell wall biosynthesis
MLDARRAFPGSLPGPVALILPWYGPDVPGGAETDARHLAEHLCAAGYAAEVWTTCVRGLGSDWNENYHPPGRTMINGVPVTRFPVDVMNRDRYWSIHRRLAFGQAVTPREEALFLSQSIRSQALCDHIGNHPRYLCCFMPYPFGTTYWGAYVAPERSVLIPCLHDEATARLRALRHLFRSVRGILCNSEAEARLVRRLYGVPEERLAVIGVGIGLNGQGDGAAFRERYGIRAPFLLYVGRKSYGKNIPLLVNYFCRYQRHHRRRDIPLKLVLIGPGQAQVPPDCRDAVRDLGFVSEQTKLDAYAAATLLSHPSVNESFAIVLMEAWVQGTAALVNARCDVMREHCQKSQGGLYFRNYAEFEACLDLLLSDASFRERLGERGRRYVAQNYMWEQVMNRFLAAVQTLAG